MNTRVLVLILGAFLWQVTETLPIGLLPDMSRGLNISDSQSGLLITAYAWTVALTSIPLTLLTSGWDRRVLVIILMSALGILDILSALTSSYITILVFRCVLALGNGVFWSIISSLVIRVAPGLPAAKAASLAFAGSAVAYAFGTPLTSAIGEWLGWRAAFAISGVSSLVVLAVSASTLPALSGNQRYVDVLALLKEPILRYISVLTMIAVSAQFVCFTFIVTLLKNYAHISPSMISLLLSGYGIANILANFMGGYLPFKTSKIILLSLSGLIMVFSFFLCWPTSEVGSWISTILWGASASLLNLSLQGYALELYPEQKEAASSFCVAGYNIGIGAGAFLGGFFLNYGGVTSILIFSIALAILSAVILRSRPIPAE